MNKELILKFDNHTIEHLGIKMYSRLPNALAELIANSYDASAENVKICFNENANTREIIIEDDGDGMNFDEINDDFLVIGRKRREFDRKRVNEKGRMITGKKGLGKLALFGIGKRIEITTSTDKDDYETVFVMDWEELMKEKSAAYKPVFKQNKKENKSSHGTKIVLNKLTRVSKFNIDEIAISLTRLFNFYDSTFKVKVINENREIELDREKVYEFVKIEKEWKVEDIVKVIEDANSNIKTITGKIFSSEKPMNQNLRGITVYANGRLVNVPCFFGLPEAGHVFSYLSGWIDANYLDEFTEDEYIATDRQSLNWDLEETVELQEVMKKVVRTISKEWSELRKENKERKFKERTNINKREWLQNVPDDLRSDLDGVINSIYDSETIEDGIYSDTINKLYKLLPPYTYWHYRYLHREIQKRSEEGYKNGNYYLAFQEAMKCYKDKVKEKSGTKQIEDYSIMAESFGKDKKNKLKPLEVTSNYKNLFNETTLGNIEEGQKYLSMGVAAGGRNPLSHEEYQKLKDTGLFTEKDCLDMLSILSHLFRRLDES